jgi:hypothetical protein
MSTPLFQEALIEAKKLREAAANEAKNAVLEAVSPMIKQMIDREISGVILEQEEPAAPMDAPPPAPPAPSPDAGAVAPVEPAPDAGAEVPPPSAMPGMAPAVAKAAPPIVAPEGTSVPGKFETDPATGQPQIVLNINDLFTKTAPEAAMETEALPAETPAPESATPEAPAGPPAEMPMAPEEEGAPAPQALAEIYHAVNRLLAEQKKKVVVKEQAAPPAPPAAPPPADPNAAAAPPAPPADPNAAAAPPAVPGATPPITPAPNAAAPAPAAPAAPGAVPPATPGVTPDQMMGATPPADPNAAPPPAAPAAPAAPPAVPGATPPAAPAPVMEYKNFKTKLASLEETVGQLVKRGSIRSSFIKENHEKEVLSLYKQLVGLRSKNAISSRVFGHNEERLDLLNENLNLVYSYTKNPLTKENAMKTKNSLRDFARSLFEGAEGFEKEVGHVEPAGESEGGSAEHAHKVSGNPKGHKAEAEKAKFATKEKSEWPGKPAPTSLLEQLEEEIAEMMGELHGEEEGLHEQDGEGGEDEGMEEAVLEMDEEEVMMEARKARARLKALREQAEGEEGGEDHLSLTIDLDGVSGEEVENVNVSIDGEELDVDMGGEEGGEEEDMEMSGEEEVAPEGEEEVMAEARKAVRTALKPVNENVVLRKQLDETQLLTARSLYLNKLFVRDDLSGAQKRKIVEYLDSARTIAEAKEIYNRVTRVLNTAKSKGMMSESATRPTRMLNEAVEPSFDTSRWQILAGVKKTAK